LTLKRVHSLAFFGALQEPQASLTLAALTLFRARSSTTTCYGWGRWLMRYSNRCVNYECRIV